MSVGALISAYQEEDSGRLRAIMPLAGRTLIDYQARSAAAAGAAPIVIMVDRVPKLLQDEIERLRADGVPVHAVSDVADAASRFEAGATVLLIGDGIIAPPDLLLNLAEGAEPTIVTVPDDEAHRAFERIDGTQRWAGVAAIDSSLIGSTAAMLGDWDLQSTLLRRAVQEGTRRMPVDEEINRTVLADTADEVAQFERGLFTSSRGPRNDWVSRFVLPPIEDFATLRLLDRSIRPQWLVWAALALTGLATASFFHGWPVAGLILLLFALPLDLIGERLARLRLRPMPSRSWARRALWPAAGLAALALGWWQAGEGAGWAPFIAAASACAFAEAARVERAAFPPGAEIWLFSRRSAIVAAVPFALLGAWTLYLVVLWLYAAVSFFIVQHARHRAKELTSN